MSADTKKSADIVRHELASDGYELSDEEYQKVLEYSERKLKLIDKPQEYLVLIIEDAIKVEVISKAINAITYAGMED